MPWLQRKRSQMMMPRRRRAPRAEPKNEHRPFDFRFFVDITTLLASIATVIALALLIHDRRDQADIAAWSLLQGYLQGSQREVNLGQGFALETLVRHGVWLDSLDAHDTVIQQANLHGLHGYHASFKHATLTPVDLSNAELLWANFEGARIFRCRCQGTNFAYSNLRGAALLGGAYQGANFEGADISDLGFGIKFSASEGNGFSLDLVQLPVLNTDAFKGACYRPGHPPRLSKMPLDPSDMSLDLDKKISMPVDPQGTWCMQNWGKTWAALEKP